MKMLTSVNSSILILLTILLTGCGGESNRSPLVGSWITESCAQSSNEDGELVNTWIKTIYEFTSDNSINLGYLYFNYSDCVTVDFVETPATTEVSMTYVDQGEVVLQEGMNGNQISIEMPSDSKFFSMDGYYTIDNGKVCFSDAFSFRPLGFGMSQAGSSEIDFENCLVNY